MLASLVCNDEAYLIADGGTYGGANRVLNNYIYDEDKSVVDSTVFGMAGGGAGYLSGSYTWAVTSKYFPKRINGAPIDSNKPILLQNIGILNPYPGYVGKSVEQVTEWAIPAVLDRQGSAND